MADGASRLDKDFSSYINDIEEQVSTLIDTAGQSYPTYLDSASLEQFGLPALPALEASSTPSPHSTPSPLRANSPYAMNNSNAPFPSTSNSPYIAPHLIAGDSSPVDSGDFQGLFNSAVQQSESYYASMADTRRTSNSTLAHSLSSDDEGTRIGLGSPLLQLGASNDFEKALSPYNTPTPSEGPCVIFTPAHVSPPPPQPYLPYSSSASGSPSPAPSPNYWSPSPDPPVYAPPQTAGPSRKRKLDQAEEDYSQQSQQYMALMVSAPPVAGPSSVPNRRPKQNLYPSSLYVGAPSPIAVPTSGLSQFARPPQRQAVAKRKRTIEDHLGDLDGDGDDDGSSYQSTPEPEPKRARLTKVQARKADAKPAAVAAGTPKKRNAKKSPQSSGPPKPYQAGWDPYQVSLQQWINDVVEDVHERGFTSSLAGATCRLCDKKLSTLARHVLTHRFTDVKIFLGHAKATSTNDAPGCTQSTQLIQLVHFVISNLRSRPQRTGQQLDPVLVTEMNHFLNEFPEKWGRSLNVSDLGSRFPTLYGRVQDGANFWYNRWACPTCDTKCSRKDARKRHQMDKCPQSPLYNPKVNGKRAALAGVNATVDDGDDGDDTLDPEDWMW